MKEEVEIETHTGKIKILLKDVWQIWCFHSLPREEKFTHTLRIFDRTRKYLHHIYGITKETAEMLSEKTKVPIWNEKEYEKNKKSFEEDNREVLKHFESEDKTLKFLELMGMKK